MRVWRRPAAETARIGVIIIMTYLGALGGYSHIIAGSVEVFYSIMTGDANWSNYLFDWMPPTILGNILGGFSLVAVLGHAQVVNESGNEKANSASLGIRKGARASSPWAIVMRSPFTRISLTRYSLASCFNRSWSVGCIGVW